MSFHSFRKLTVFPAICALAIATIGPAMAGNIWATGGAGQRFYSAKNKFWVQALRVQTSGNKVYAVFQTGVGAAECVNHPASDGPVLNIKLLDPKGTQFFIIQNIKALSVAPDQNTVIQEKIDISDKVSVDDVNAAASVEAFMPGDAKC